MQREILTGAVAELHQQHEQTVASFEELRTEALRVKAERDEAIGLLQRVLSFRDGALVHILQADLRLFLARVRELPAEQRSITAINRQQMLERELVTARPEADEALTLLQAWYRGVEERFGEDRCVDLKARTNEVEEALAEMDGAAYSDALAKVKRR